MEMEKIVGAEQIIYQDEEGEQKIYILPDQEAVEKLLAKLNDSGLSDTIELSLSRLGAGQKENKQHDPLLAEMKNGLQGMADTPTPNPLHYHSMEEIEKVLGEENLVFDGEQKVYVMPKNIDIDQLLGNFKGLRTGEIKQSQMWRKTDNKIGSKEQSDMIEAMDKRIRRLEFLLSQAVGQEQKTDNNEMT